MTNVRSAIGFGFNDGIIMKVIAVEQRAMPHAGKIYRTFVPI